MKKHYRTLIWLLVAVVAVLLLMRQTPRETFEQAVRQIRWGWAVGAVLLYLIHQSLLATRWVLLLKVHQVHISLLQAIRLTYLGLFYNNFMPGAVGGDLLKGWYITRHSAKDRRVEAAVTVFVDRLVGLIGMVLIGSIASLFVGPAMAYEGIQIRWIIWGIFLVMVLAAVIFLSRRIRHFLFLTTLLEKLPFAQRLKQIEQAIRIYRRHPGTMLLALAGTAVIQGFSIVAIFVMTQALNLEKVTLVQCLIIMPIVWVISVAVPVPGGLGIVENLVTYLFCVVINPAAPKDSLGQAAALALMIRLLICVCSLPGALVPVFGGHLPKRSEMQRDMMESGSP